MSDSDQKSILRGQWTAEKEIMDFSGDSVILVTDGSTINAQFYAHTQILDRERCVQQYDILFFSRNIERPVDSNKDGNRVHDADFSVQVDAAMKNYFDRERHPQVIELSGGVDERVGKALSAIAEMIKMLEGNVQ